MTFPGLGFGAPAAGSRRGSCSVCVWSGLCEVSFLHLSLGLAGRGPSLEGRLQKNRRTPCSLQHMYNRQDMEAAHVPIYVHLHNAILRGC